MIFDSSFRFSAQVSSICSSSYYHIQDFARTRRYLDKLTAIAVANALVSSRLDYCNSLLNSISEYDLKRLNSIQYSLCRIVQRTSRFSREHMSPHLRLLHWLPVNNDQLLLQHPSVGTDSYGRHAFSYTALTVWNKLPYKIRNAPSVTLFRKN